MNQLNSLNINSLFHIPTLDIPEYTYGAAADLQRTSLYFNNNNNNLVDSKEVQFGAFNPQIHSSNLRSDNIDTPNAHLLDHNYAASAFDECFGDSWKGKICALSIAHEVFT